MKKLFCLLIALLLVPLISFAETPDPIVGTWYMYSGFVDDSDVYFEFHTFTFTADGCVFSTMYDIGKDGTTSAKDYHVFAMWTKENDKYYINVGMQGAEELVFEKDSLFFPVSDSYKIRAWKMKQINYVKDFMQ